MCRWLSSGASGKGTRRGVQHAPYSLEVAGTSPGYSTTDCGWDLPGGGAQLAKRRLRGGARVSSAHRVPATPVDWPGACGLACKLPRAAWSSNAVALRWLHGGPAK